MIGSSTGRQALGSPVLFGADPATRQFSMLPAISTRRDDPGSFDEDLLQSLIARAPNVLPIRDFLRSASALFSLAREVRVDIGGSDGYIDNLLVTNEGHLVIVETKLYRNPESTREVVTQAMQYAMAISGLSLSKLEIGIRNAMGSALQQGETIKECVVRMAAEGDGAAVAIADDFEESLERYVRQGELLLLVASDSFKFAVERLTDWLNDQGSSSPLKFGLVELKFYTLGDQRLVVPRPVLRTTEVSRHVVVVELPEKTDSGITARVTDDFTTTSGGKAQESRPVKASVPLTKNTLLQQLRPEDVQAASQLIGELAAVGLDQKGTSSTLKFGFTTEDTEFHTLLALDKSGAWAGPLKKDIDVLGTEELLVFRKKANEFAPFYRPDQWDQISSFGCAGKYQHLQSSASAFAAFLSEYRDKLVNLLHEGYE